MTYGIPKTSFGPGASPSIDGATWFNHLAFTAPRKREATDLRQRDAELKARPKGSEKKRRRLARREIAALNRVWAKHQRAEEFR